MEGLHNRPVKDGPPGLGIQLALLAHNTIILANFITALLVPWATANYRVATGWFDLYLPVDLGLVQCFSELCDTSQGASKHFNAQKASSGGTRTLFEVAGILTIILLAGALLLALGSAVLEIARIQSNGVNDMLWGSFRLSFLSSLVTMAALFLYLIITLAGLHGGNYKVGFWLTLATSVLTALLALAQIYINRQSGREVPDGLAGSIFRPLDQNWDYNPARRRKGGGTQARATGEVESQEQMLPREAQGYGSVVEV